MAAAYVSWPTFLPFNIEFWASYEILNDPNTRETYDNYGMAGLAGPGGGGRGMSAEEMFAQFFGGGGGSSFGFDFGPEGPSGRRRKQNEVVPYDVTLEDLYNGKTVRINMEKDVTCGTCQGYAFSFSKFQGPILCYLSGQVLKMVQNLNNALNARVKVGRLSQHKSAEKPMHFFH